MSQRVLIVDDDQATRRMLGRALANRGYRPAEHASAADALEALEAEPFDVVLTDLMMPGIDGLELCRRIARDHPDVPVIMVTAYGSLDSAVEAIRAGAADYVQKPFSIDQLIGVVDRAVSQRKLRADVRRLRSVGPGGAALGTMIGSSPAMRQVYALVQRAAATDTTVLLTGESGTGKELAARELHRLSERTNGPFVAVNCAALPAPLLESELFGHMKGSFTDATSDRRGLLEEASGGTIFLDEIADLPSHLQPKLLRVLQERSFRPVGGNREVPFDARIVAATNTDLERAVQEGTFRKDLFYRINVLAIHMPALRERGRDILLLAQQFIREHARGNGHARAVSGITPEAAEKLLSYPWPGNVRELRNCIESAVAMTQHDQIGVGDLPARVADYEGREHVSTEREPAQLPTLAEVEGDHIRRVIAAVDGNKAAAARILGLDRKTLYRRLQRLGIESGSNGERGDRDRATGT